MELKRNTLVVAALGVFPALFGLSGCSGLLDSFGGEKQDLASVNDLGEQVRSVHVESEISRDRLRAAVDALRELTDPAFNGDPQASFERYVVAIEASEKQAKSLRKRVEPMADSAERFFSHWSKDLDDFQRAELRKRSKERLHRTRKLYKEIEYAVDPAQSYFDEINSRLRDFATFLSNDFNASAVASIAPDVRELSQLASKLDKRFETCLGVTAEYGESTGMYGAPVVPLEPENVASRSAQ